MPFIFKRAGSEYFIKTKAGIDAHASPNTMNLLAASCGVLNQTFE
jgi:hypothetical protein